MDRRFSASSLPQMKVKKQIIYLSLLAVLVLILAVRYEFYHRSQNLKSITETDSLKYAKLVTAEDRAPLSVPEKASIVKIPILMYHHVGDFPAKASKTRKDLTVSATDFENEVRWFAEEGYTSIRLEDIYLLSRDKFSLPKKPIVFTFDDGYRDVFLNAIPILKKYNFVGSFAIITQYPGGKQGDNFYASWPEIAAARDAGMEIVSHTQNHFDGKDKKYSINFIAKNLAGSIEDIKNHLGFTANILIYPYGHYTSAEITEAKKLGLVMGLTVHEGDQIDLNNLLEIPRIRVHGKENKENIETFKKILSR